MPLARLPSAAPEEQLSGEAGRLRSYTLARLNGERRHVSRLAALRGADLERVWTSIGALRRRLGLD